MICNQPIWFQLFNHSLTAQGSDLPLKLFHLRAWFQLRIRYMQNSTFSKRVRLNRVGGWVVGGSVGVVGRGRGSNLQLPAHVLISPNSFYETLNKGKLSPINYKHFSFWSGKQINYLQKLKAEANNWEKSCVMAATELLSHFLANISWDFCLHVWS